MRQGPRPRIAREFPHTQLDQWGDPLIAEQLRLRIATIPNVSLRVSRIASPSVQALWMHDEFAGGPPVAFADDHEFCYLHPCPPGSLHMTLPPSIHDAGVQLGWFERHPGIVSGALPETFVMVYAPRDASELEVAFQLVLQSAHFARGNR
ncbi:MAG: hypothetical protein JNL98_04980 [Bryobacterales bacterium]|nr:hypothetical protein [Bryobacterales bacterium]